MGQLKILLVEDEPIEIEAMVQYAEDCDEVKIVAATNNETGALSHVRDFLPDVVILDLELHKGGGTGLSFLQELRVLDAVPRPFILVTTNNTSRIILDGSRELGADFVMLKNEPDYGPEKVIGFLVSMKKIILDSQKRKQPLSPADDSPAKLRTRLQKRANLEVERIGISPKAVGRKYLIDGIILIYSGMEYNIVPEIAKKYDKSDSSVERAMQNAINVAWRTTDIEDLQRYYTARIGSARGVPTISEFLHYYADKFKTEY